jgi:hypothetical protein
LKRAWSVADPDVRLAWHDISDEWFALAVQIAQHAGLEFPQAAPAAPPAEPARPVEVPALKFAEILRERLTLAKRST